MSYPGLLEALTSSIKDPFGIPDPRPTAPMSGSYYGPPAPAVCECGSHKLGIKPHQPGHSPWCPAK